MLPLQLWLRLVDGLPAAAIVARPTTSIAVVAVHGAVFTGIDIVLSSGNAGVRVGVIDEAAAICRTLARVDVANVTGATASDDPRVWIVGRSAAVASRVASVYVGVVSPSRDRCPASLGIVIGAASSRSISASFASGVPGTEASTVALGLSAGIFVRSGGMSVAFTKAQGPSSVAPLNQRPEIRM